MSTIKTKDTLSLVISPQNPDTKWVALNNTNAIIAEGKTPEEALQKANKLTGEFSLMFVPSEGNTYIF